MTKYHITKRGEPGVCRAAKSCPLGGESEHYETKADAAAAYENAQRDQTLPAAQSEGLSTDDRKSFRQFLDNDSLHDNNGFTRGGSEDFKKKMSTDAKFRKAVDDAAAAAGVNLRTHLVDSITPVDNPSFHMHMADQLTESAYEVEDEDEYARDLLGDDEEELRPMLDATLEGEYDEDDEGQQKQMERLSYKVAQKLVRDSAASDEDESTFHLTTFLGKEVFIDTCPRSLMEEDELYLAQ